MATGKHYGAFGKGFMDGILGVYKLYMTKQLYDARAQYYKDRGDAARENAGTRANKGAGLASAEADSRAGWGGGNYKEPTADVASRAQQYSDYLQGQGYTKAGASAILGNWWQENSLKGGGWGGDNGTSAGGFQWHNDRGTGFVNWAQANNLDINDPMTSLKYAVHDLNTDSRYRALNSELKSTDDVDQATKNFTSVYERPLPATANVPNRVGFARTVYGGKATEKPATTATTVAPATTSTKTKTPPAKSAPATAPTTAQATPLPDDQLAGGTDEEAMAIAIRKNQELKEQQNRDSPAPPPGSAPPRNERSLPPPEQAPLPGAGAKIGAIPPGPTVPAEEGRFDVPPESGYPESAQTLPVTQAPGPEDPEIAARQAHGQGTLPPPRMYHSLQPSDMPSSGVGASAHSSQYGPPLPPRATINPATDTSPVMDGAATINPATDRSPTAPARPGSPPHTTTPATAYDPKTIYGPPQPTEADKPAPAAQPVSATAPTQGRTNPQGNSPGWVTEDRPNADPTNARSGGAPQMGMLDLSKLWGSNPPLAQRTAAPNVSSTPRQQDDWGGVASAPSMDDMALGMQIGAAKGGPIRRYAQGGAIPSRATATKFADGGGAGGNTYTTPGQN